MLYRFKGFHGTSLRSAKLIISSNYELSVGDDEWLGNGVYFFIEGISSKPEKQAEEWAKVQAWDNVHKRNKYDRFSVITSIIEVEKSNFLDLTKEEGVEVLTYLTTQLEDKIKKLKKSLKFMDGLVLNLARGEGILDIDVVKGNFYIKFARERIYGINLRTNNCTICTVFEPNKNLTKSTILKTGNV